MTEDTSYIEIDLDFIEKGSPSFTVKDNILKIEWNLKNNKIDMEFDNGIKEYFEDTGEWKWYAQGVNLTTNPHRRDMCFERIPCQPLKVA